MKRYMFSWMAVWLGIVALSGCQLTNNANRNNSSPVAFTSLFAGNSGITNHRLEVVHDATSWQQLWQSLTAGQTPAPVLPTVDFTQQTVLAVFLGQNHPNIIATIESVDDLGTTSTSATLVRVTVGIAPVVSIAPIDQHAEVVVLDRVLEEVNFVEAMR